MYLQRKIDADLVAWKNRPHLPLIVSGARQVGKTEAILHFGHAHYASVIYLNFALEPKWRHITAEGYSAASVIREMTLIDGYLDFKPNETLIVFDEIQDFPDIATSLKSFREDGRFDVIASGSLLGVQYQKIASLAVGNQESYELCSLDFEEFLWANGRDATFIDQIYTAMKTLTPFSENQLKTINDLFMTYCIVGGMPAIVARYVEQQNFQGISLLQHSLIDSYCADARKYCEGLDQSRIVEIYQNVPAQLAKENKKFQYAKVHKGARARDYVGCVQWLQDAGLVLRCSCLSSLELPLRGHVLADCFKLYYPDTSLLLANFDEEAAEDFRLNRNIHTYRGGLVENIVAEALYKATRKLFYFKRENSTLELDFLLRTPDSLVPVEVKASNNKSKSLSTAITSSAHPDVKFGIKLTAGNIGFEKNIHTFPHFCAFLLPRFLKDKA